MTGWHLKEQSGADWGSGLVEVLGVLDAPPMPASAATW